MTWKFAYLYIKSTGRHRFFSGVVPLWLKGSRKFRAENVRIERYVVLVTIGAICLLYARAKFSWSGDYNDRPEGRGPIQIPVQGFEKF